MDRMNENFELLEYIYACADMGMKSCEKLLKILKEKDNKIKKVLESELKEYESFYKESDKLLKKNKVEPKTKGLFASLMADVSMQIEVAKDNSDSKIADLIIRGMTMGTIDIQKRLDHFEGEVNKDIHKLAKSLLKFQEDNIELLKEYL